MRRIVLWFALSVTASVPAVAGDPIFRYGRVSGNGHPGYSVNGYSTMGLGSVPSREYGGFSLSGPSGSFTMYHGPFVPYAPNWGYGYTTGYPVYLPAEDFGFGPNPPAVIGPVPMRLADRLRNARQPADGQVAPEPKHNPVANGNAPAAAPVDEQPDQDNPPLFLKRSNVEQRRKSLRLQAQGDDLLRRAEYLPAVGKYRQAAQAAPDLSEPRLRMGIALAAMGELSQGVVHLKRGLNLDPEWPKHGPGLEELFGPHNEIARVTLLGRASGWVRQDIRDPDRLFLLGVLLYFNEDVEPARKFFETAMELTEGTSPAGRFLEPHQVSNAARKRVPSPAEPTEKSTPSPAPPRAARRKPLDDAPVPEPPD
ncbi:MAG: hypothetical protein NT069_01555 [Planctomycetota bacterium]|nr:hypothetical protein [Planctomycetota bacterium]